MQSVDPQVVGVGKQFVEHYYGIFDSNRAGLTQIYQQQTTLTWEGKFLSGADAIVKHIVELPFQQTNRKINSIDCQQTYQPGIMITVTGTLIIDGEAKNQLKFVQVFNLASNNGSFLLINDFFRLVLD
ncbi:nuclear transport factor 2 [Dictyostelium discoideum AX4]|uniref:Nuclear transport factor 2 n=1 Tax=Dictyostelium discoideum TaxID=44689 RepID=NTF2_DICDI|nr:nuclear transport factor 2 [Dictyostelium discoideum AX4]Q86HW7.1 RecName: Full=Nuclear transport factor 2; Short=NTF-2 [Dictyostelium discoideum]EAL69166.1 nuclear transport factor 2 [Dictyostelium discoideum AX4]|eukprot:XP_643125.1 nuclear transport factor 2 [Dictyostelium discoideum AX4]